MRVLVAPDKFAGTLTAVEAADAIAEGWSAAAPGDDVRTVPMSDGGPGFLDVLHAALGGELHAVTVTGPLGDPVPATLLLVGDTSGSGGSGDTSGSGGSGDTAYVESSQACGLALVPPERREPERATTYGVGELLAAAVGAGAGRIVVGLGGSGTNDGGAGLLAALGAVGVPASALTGGAAGLPELRSLDVGPARARLSGVRILAASDVDNPLLGLRGAINVFGPQKGVPAERLVALDAILERYAERVDPELAGAKGAGAAGGLGYALLLVGAERVAGIETIAGAVGLAAAAAEADVVLSGEGSFDISSSGGKVVAGVAAAAGRAARPCVVLAGQVLVGAREMRAMGVEAAYSLVDVVGRPAAMGRPRESLLTLAGRVARTWSR